jgi:hypothetical protein
MILHGISLPDISDYHNLNDIFIIFFAILMMEVGLIFSVRYIPALFGDLYKTLNEWYSTFQFTAVISDVLIILLMFIIARYIYTLWIKPRYGWNPLIFVGLLIGLQIMRELLFYLTAILPIPFGKNQLIDLFKQYSMRATPKIIGGNMLLISIAALIAFYYKTQPMHILVTASVLALYNITYVLYTRQT